MRTKNTSWSSFVRTSTATRDAAILHQIKTIAPERGVNPSRPFFIVADEFQKFATNDFADGLDRLRGFGIHFILSHQHLTQLGKDDTTLLDSAVTNSNNKIYFSISAKDAKETAEELFTGWTHADEVKDEITQTKFRPVETTRIIVSHGRTESEGESTGFGHASGSGGASISGHNTSIGTGGTPDNPTYVDTAADSSSEVTSSMESDSETYTKSHSIATSESAAKVPWYKQEEFKELSGRTFRSVEELRERYKGFLVNQDQRRFQWKIHRAFPHALEAPEIRPIPVTEREKREFFETVHGREMRPGIPLYSKKALLIEEIDKRVGVYLEPHWPSVDENDSPSATIEESSDPNILAGDPRAFKPSSKRNERKRTKSPQVDLAEAIKNVKTKTPR